MSAIANNEPIPVDDQSLFFRQIIDSSPALLHTARPDGYLDFFNQNWLNFSGEPLEKLLGWLLRATEEIGDMRNKHVRQGCLRFDGFRRACGTAGAEKN